MQFCSLHKKNLTKLNLLSYKQQLTKLRFLSLEKQSTNGEYDWSLEYYKELGIARLSSSFSLSIEELGDTERKKWMKQIEWKQMKQQEPGLKQREVNLHMQLVIDRICCENILWMQQIYMSSKKHWTSLWKIRPLRITKCMEKTSTSARPWSESWTQGEY